MVESMASIQFLNKSINQSFRNQIFICLMPHYSSIPRTLMISIRHMPFDLVIRRDVN